MSERTKEIVTALWLLLIVLLIILASSVANAQNIEGQLIASQYGAWQVSGYAPDTYTGFAPTACRVQGGSSFFPAFEVGTPIMIVDSNPSFTEVVAPTNVVVNNNTCAIAISPVNHHNLPFYLTSATGGLQEAIDANYANPASNTIVLDNRFYQTVGPANVAAIINAAAGRSNLGLVDITQTPYVWYTWNGSHYVVSEGYPVDSVFGRVGNVVAQSGDYDCAQVTGCLTSAPVTSVFGRTGPVTANSGDYDCDEVTGCGVAPNIALSSQLAASIGTSDTTIPLSNSTARLTVPGVVVIDSEWIQYTGVSGDNLTGAARGYHQTTAAGHSSGAYAYSVLLDFGNRSQLPAYAMVTNRGALTWGAVFGCGTPDPASGVLQIGCNPNDTYFDTYGGIKQFSGSTKNFLYSTTGIGPGGGFAPITNSGYLFDSTRQNNSTVTQGFSAGITPLVAAVQPPIIPAPTVVNFAGTGSTTWSWRCTGTDVDGNTFPGTDVTITNGPASISGGGYFDVTCPYSSGAVTESIWRTAGPNTTGLLLTGSMPAFSPDTDIAVFGTPPAVNSSVPKVCVGSGEVSCMVTSVGVPSGSCINGWFDLNQSGSPATLNQCVGSAWQAVGPPVLSGISGSIGGSALAAGACASTTVAITGLTTSMDVHATPSVYPGDGYWWEAYASASGTATVKVCAAVSGTPTASTYDLRVNQ